MMKMSKGRSPWYKGHIYFSVRKGRFMPCTVSPLSSVLVILVMGPVLIGYMAATIMEYCGQDLENVGWDFLYRLFIIPIFLGVIYSMTIAALLRKVTFYFHIPMRPPVPRLVASAAAGLVVGLWLSPLVLMYRMPEIMGSGNAGFLVLVIIYMLPVNTAGCYYLYITIKAGWSGALLVAMTALAMMSMLVNQVTTRGLATFMVLVDIAYFWLLFVVMDMVVLSVVLVIMMRTPDEVFEDLPETLGGKERK
jgi:hypothetical protein